MRRKMYNETFVYSSGDISRQLPWRVRRKRAGHLMQVQPCQSSGQIRDCRHLFTNFRGSGNRNEDLRWSRKHDGDLHRERTYDWINNWSQNCHKRNPEGNLHRQLRRHRRYHAHYHAGERRNNYLRGRLRHHSGDLERHYNRQHNCRCRGKPDHFGRYPGWPLSNPCSKPAAVLKWPVVHVTNSVGGAQA